METRSADGTAVGPIDSSGTRPGGGTHDPPPGSPAPGAPARWSRPLVRLDAVWTRVETYMVLAVLLLAIFYMSGWVTLNAFHTKAGRLAKFPGGIALFAGVASLVTWFRRPGRRAFGWFVPVVFCALGATLLAVTHKQAYFANVARWLADASMVKQMGTPEIVSARLFTIWVALLGGSLATGAGRQINIDVVMRFIGPRPRLAVALIGYVLAAASSFAISWAFCDYLAITAYGAPKELLPREKLAEIGKGVRRHAFIARRQIGLDLRSFGHVVLKGEPFDKWYTAGEWNRELNDAGWASIYPPPSGASSPMGAPPPPAKPCLSPQELEELTNKGQAISGEWRLPAACDLSDPSATRAPLAVAPEPDDRTPLQADLSLLFPWGFFLIGCRFLLRGALALGGAVSTDPNAAHGADAPVHELTPDLLGGAPTDLPAAAAPPVDPTAPKFARDAETLIAPVPLVAHHPPIVERRVDQEALAHEGELALPRDDISIHDALIAAGAKVDAAVVDIDAASKGRGGEPPHHDIASLEMPPPQVARSADAEHAQHDIPTAERLEAAKLAAEEEEDEVTKVGDLSDLALAHERVEAEKMRRAAAARSAPSTPSTPRAPSAPVGPSTPPGRGPKEGT